MKPECLKESESSFSFGHSHFVDNSKSLFGAEINFPDFDGYLINEAPHSFTIITIKNQYKCNIFGVYSSSVIRKILTEDPTTDKYVFDYEDEFNEFQSICDLFNFSKVILTKDNIDSIKEITEELEINYFVKDIDNYINTSEKVSKTIDNQQTIVDSIDNLFDLLYHIEEKTVSSVKMSILNSKWSKTEDNIKELAAFIIQVINTDIQLHKYILDLLLQFDQETNEMKILLPFITKQLMKIAFGSNNDKFVRQKNYMLIYAFIYNLFKRGIVSKKDLFEKLSNTNNRNYAMNCWFLPELLEINPNETFKKAELLGIITNELFQKAELLGINPNEAFQKSDSLYLNFINSFLPDKIHLYKKVRDNEEPVDELTMALRKDDVDTVQKILSSRNGLSSESLIPFNLFESFVPNGTTNYIKYAAAYGFIKSFKYLLLNHQKIDNKTFTHAILGGNIEIIRIVEQNEPTMNDYDSQNVLRDKLIEHLKNKQLIDNPISLSIVKHRNDLFDWILEHKFANANNDELHSLFFCSVENGNAHSLIEIIDKGFNYYNNKSSYLNAIRISAKNGFYLLAQLISNLMEEKMQNSIDSKDEDFTESVFYDNVTIFKIFEKTLNQNNFEKILYFAAQNELTSIIKYFFEKLIKGSFKMKLECAFESLSKSLDNKTNEIFNYLLDFIKANYPEFIKYTVQFQSLLIKACKSGNTEGVKKKTELIIDNNIENIDFTLAFLVSAFLNEIDICYYFLNKKVSINFEIIASQILNFSSINEELFSKIFNNISPESRYQITQNFEFFIKTKNIGIVKFLLKEKPKCNKELFAAVETNDVEFVDVILNYNSSSYFINQLSTWGTALAIAVRNDNLPIVQKLLSIPEINPSLYTHNKQTPLSIAIVNLNLEITNAILDFYGDTIQAQIWQIEVALDQVLMHDSKRKNDLNDKSNLLQILKRLLDIKCLNRNHIFSNETLLTYACSNNSIELVQMLLEYDDVDVNFCELNDGNSPLIISISKCNEDIVKLLINHPKININQINYAGLSPLIVAVNSSNSVCATIIDLIVKSDKFKSDESLLDYAFFLSPAEICKHLLSVKSLDVNYEKVQYSDRFDSDRLDSDRLDLKIRDMFNDNVNFLRKYKMINVKTSLTEAVEHVDIEKINLIIQHPSFNKVKSNLKEAIILSVRKENISIFQKLLKIADNNVNITDINGKSLLYNSVINLNLIFINEILKNPNFDSKKSDILSCFIKSCDNRKSELVINAMNELYNYDKHHDHLINFTKLLPNGNSFFTEVGYSINGQIFNFFIENGVDPNEPDQNEVYPLQKAIQVNSKDGVEALINSGKIDYTKQIPINSHVKMHIDINRSKLNPRTNIQEILGLNYTTYLHLAASENKSILELFLTNKIIDINITNDLGETPLFTACKLKKCENVQLLFEYDDLDYLHCNNEGKTVFDLLNTSGHKQEDLSKSQCLQLLLCQLQRSNSDGLFSSLSLSKALIENSDKPI